MGIGTGDRERPRNGGASLSGLAWQTMAVEIVKVRGDGRGGKWLIVVPCLIHSPKVDTAFKLGDALRVQLSELLEGVG